jgi:hypothetical protein
MAAVDIFIGLVRPYHSGNSVTTLQKNFKWNIEVLFVAAAYNDSMNSVDISD